MNELTTMNFDQKQIDIIKNMYFKGLDNDELQIFLHACRRTQLDPFMRQIFAVPRWDSKANKNTITIQTGIDGYRLIAERTGRYAPGKEPIYRYTEDGKIIFCTAFVKKQTTDGSWHEVAATAFFDEYCQRTKDGSPTQFWKKMGHTMIAKCAEALALRKAFPGDLSGVYTKEEMEQAEVENIETGSPETTPATLQIEQLKSSQEEEDKTWIQAFSTQYPEEKEADIDAFLRLLGESWKKPMMYVVEKYRDNEKFMTDFGKWKEKKKKEE